MPFAPFDPSTVNAREFHKFKLDTDGEVCVRVCFGAGETFNVTSTPAGLSQAGEVTIVSVGTSATLLPTVALTDRNHVAVHNKSTVEILYVRFDNTVTADDTATGGWEIEPESKLNFDLQDNVPLYGIVASGTATVKVLEM